MKSIKRILALALCAAMLVPCALFRSSAAESQPGGCYPVVFIHGLNGWGGAEGINGIIPYWGATTGDLMPVLEKKGYECYSASVGPISSAWDRACELYAQLTGTRVDYGAAHSAANNHLRYGRTYEAPLIENWGGLDEQGKIQKIHLVGHSFGGTTARMLVQLLSEGSAQERAASPGDCSPLFEGGKASWVHSVTTVCTPHNSTTLYYPLELLGAIDTFRYASALYIGSAGRSWANGRYFDFHMEQFGLSYVPGSRDADSYFKAVKRLVDNTQDTAIYDLTPAGMKELNGFFEIQQGIYYYSYAFSTTKAVEPLRISLPAINTNPVIAALSLMMGVMPEFTDKELEISYDASWQMNDALVNTQSELYPLDEPHTDYDPGAQPLTGVWNVMPVHSGDHGKAIGLLAPTVPTQEFYFELMALLAELPG